MVLIIIIVPLILSLLLSIPAVQNFAVDKFSSYLSERTGTRFEVGTLYIRFFNRVELGSVYVEDYSRDTLLYAGTIDVGFRGYNVATKTVMLSGVKLNHVDFFLQQDSTGKLNMTRLLNHFKSNKPKKPSTAPFKMKAASVQIDSVHFKYRRNTIPDKPAGSINFSDLDVRGFSLYAQQLTLVDDSVTLHLDSLKFREKSGFNLRRFQTDVLRVSQTGVRLDALKFATAESEADMSRLYMEYDSWRAFSDFITAVRINADVNDCRVAFHTIAYFAPSLDKWHSTFDFNGNITGTVSDLRADFNRISTARTTLKLAFSMRGIPDIERTSFSFNVTDLHTNAVDILSLYHEFTGQSLESMRTKLTALGDVNLTGQFNGLLSDFRAAGTLQSALGQFNLDVDMRPEKGQTYLKGKVATEEFDLGKFLSVSEVGNISMVSQIEGTMGLGKMNLNTTSLISHVTYKGYDYGGIDIRGVLQPKIFDGFVGVGDPNLKMNVNGRFDFSGALPQYDFDMRVFHADLVRLHFNQRDSISQFSGTLKANATGRQLDDINGRAVISQLEYVNQIDTVRTGKITLVARNNDNDKLLALYSDFADAEFHGRLSYKNMIDYLSNTVLRYIPLLNDGSAKPSARTVAEDSNVDDNYYMLDLNIKKANNVAGIFLPGLELAEGTRLLFTFNPLLDKFMLNLKSDYIQRKNFYADSIVLNAHNNADSIMLYVKSKELYTGGVLMPNFQVLGGVKSSTVHISTSFYNHPDSTAARITTTSHISRDTHTGKPQIDLRFNPSLVMIQGDIWDFVSRNIHLGDEGIQVDGFRMHREGQLLQIQGGISNRANSDTLSLELHNFSVAPLSQFTVSQGYHLSGDLDGTAYLIGDSSRRLFYSDIDIKSLTINGNPLQDSHFRTRWDRQSQRVEVNLSNVSGKQLVSGGIEPKNKRYFLRFDLPGVDLKLAQPILSGVLSRMRGEADLYAILRGEGNKPILNGSARLKNAAASVDFTNVDYGLEGSVVISNNNFRMSGGRVTDNRGGTARMEMNFTNHYFNDLKYDIRIYPEKLLALNTTEKDNSLFFGTAYASGTVTITGERGRVGMNIVATTENNSSFAMPLNGAANAASSDFVKFESAHDTASSALPDYLARRAALKKQKDKITQSSSNIDIGMSLNVRPNTEVKLVIDPKLGDEVKARGNGTLNLHINPRNNVFSMTGDYEITQGSYLFTLRNLINKYFTIKPGSMIQWSGDPLDARLNITAIYTVKTSIANFMANAGFRATDYPGRIPVECEIQLTDRLSQPDITFDIALPNANIETQNLVQNLLSTEETRATQFMWLLVTGQFYAESSGTGDIGASATAATGLEFLSNQLGRWLSNDQFNIGINYRPKDETSSSEVGVNFDAQLSDRWSVEVAGNYGFDDNKAIANQASNLTGDFSLTYLLDRSGNLRTKLFTRTIDTFDENYGLQESGVGIYYHDDFNRFRDLVQRFLNIFRPADRKRKIDNNPSVRTPNKKAKNVSKRADRDATGGDVR